MVKLEAIEQFDLKKFNELENLKRANELKSRKGRVYVGDIFECDEEMAEYLTGKNPLNKVVVKIIEITQKTEETKKENKEEIKTEKTTKKSKKKKK